MGKGIPLFDVTINGIAYQVEDDIKLLPYLRDTLHITSVKNGCSEGACGSCTVLIDGKAARACVFSMAKLHGKQIMTVEGLSEREKQVYSWAFAQAGAVQCGFCIPGMVMCAKGLLDKNPEPTAREVKEALRSNICRCTGYVKIEQAVLLAAKALKNEIDLSRSADCRVGMNLNRVDAEAKTLGTAEYVDDLYLPDMLHGAVRRSPSARALIKTIDTEEAKALPGVVAVLTAQDVPGNRYGGFIVKDWPALVAEGEETRYIGDALAVVAATSREVALQAAALISVQYEELEPITTTAAALEPGAYAIHQSGNLLTETRILRGTPQEVLAQSAHVVTNRYTTPATEHAFMEPESALAIPGDDGSITVHSSSQSVYEDQHEIMNLLALPAEKVRVVSKMVGGAFGGKEDTVIQHHAALLAYITKKPVKITFSRQESIHVHPKRHAMELELTTGCDEQGIITAVVARIVADTGAYASLGPPVLKRACTHIGGPYHVPHADITGLCVYTNNPPAGAFRGFGVPQAAFACEGNLDILAEKVGISPWEIRYRNALEPGKINATGQIADEGTAIKETLEAVRAVCEAHSLSGIACAMKNTGIGTGAPDIGRVKIIVNEGKVLVLTSAACIGQGLATILTQLVCDTAGLPGELVEVAPPDTWLTPDSGTTTASRQTLFTGEAARQAALKLQQALADQTLANLEGQEFYGEYSGITDPMNSPKANPVGHIAYSYATQVVVLSADGKVEKVVAAHDVGRAINPKAIEGQIEGGVAMGLGYALREDFPLKKGVPQVRYGTLGLFRSTDMPVIESIIVEKNPSPLAYGAKGVGEISTIPTAPAVAAAYYRYDGKRRFALPLVNTAYKK